MGSFVGDAKQASDGFDISEENYLPVLNQIHNKFGQAYMIQTSLNAALDAVNCPTNATINETTRTINIMEGILRQLQAMRANVNNPGLHLSYKKKLPQWLLLKAYSSGIPNSLDEKESILGKRFRFDSFNRFFYGIDSGIGSTLVVYFPLSFVNVYSTPFETSNL